MTKTQALGGLIAGIVLGLVLAWTISLTGGAHAQTPGRDVAIAPGPGGMWIVHGGAVRVCIGGAVQTGVAPPAPRCGDATPLR